MQAPVGVIGGLGPAATAYFLDMVVRLTEAARDQDHLDLIVFSHSTTPDRTAFILGESDQDPGPVMAADAVRLAGLGVTFIVVPCNTAHHFTAAVVDAVDVPVVSIVGETVAEAQRRVAGLAKVGVLATDGTMAARVYHDEIERRGMTPVVPDATDQATVMRIIYEQVKAGRPVDREAFDAVVGRLRAQGAQVVLLGCTELSIVAADFNLLATDRLMIDSLDVLARRTIERSGHRVRED